MRNKLLPLTAAVALVLSAAACSDDDAGEVTAEPVVSATVDRDAMESGSTAPESTEGDTTSTSEPSADIVLGTSGSWLPEHLDTLEANESNAIPVIGFSVADERVTPRALGVGLVADP